MPIYEYRCDDCQEPFELFVRSVSRPPKAVCPQCGSEHVEKAISTVSTLGGKDAAFAAPASACAPTG